MRALTSFFIRRRDRQGSALVVTLLVVSLLMVMVLAFVAHVRMELRNVLQYQASQQARQNAVLGMQLGVARLQEFAGTDQRATSAASAVPHTASPGGLPKPGTANWSGVWAAGTSTRADGREPAPVLLDWLVSGRGTAASAALVTPGNYTSGLQANGRTTRTDEVVLVGSGTLGLPGGPAGVRAEDFVVVPRVNAGVNLAYAFWVGEENIKARINLPDTAASDSEDALRRYHAPRAAPVNAMADLETLPRYETRWDRLHSVPGLDLLYPAAAPWLRRNFHTASIHAATVLSDARSGGLKADLSLAFELDAAAFNRSEFALAMAAGDPVRTNPNQSFSNRAVFAERDPNLYAADPSANPNDDYLPGPSWHYLRDFYRLYKEADPTTGALESRPMLPNRQVSGNNTANSLIKSFTVEGINFSTDANALRQRRGTRSKVLPTGVEVHPEFQRLIMLYGLTRINGVVHLVIEPVAVVHNPYNVPIEMPGMMGLWTQVDQAIRVETFLPSTNDNGFIQAGALQYNGNWWAQGGQELQSILHGVNSSDGDTVFPFVMTKNASGTEPVRFEPGEIKYFTSGLTRTEVVTPGDVQVYRLVEGLDPGTLFQGYGYAYPLQYNRRVVATNSSVRGPLEMPPGGTVFAQLLSTPGPHYQTDRRRPGIGSVGTTDGPREYGGLHIYHLREDQLSDDFGALFFTASGSRIYMRPHTQRSAIPYGDLREVRLYPDDFVGGQFYVSGTPKRRFSETELQRVQYFAANDLYMKPVNDDQTRSKNINPFDVFTQHNPRAAMAEPWESGGGGVNGTRIPQTWSVHNRHLEAGRPDGVIGTSLDGRRGLWGDGLFAQEGGVESVVLYETPRQPMLNLQQLGQAPLSFWSYQPTFALGTSLASAYIQRERIWQSTPVSGSVVSFQFDNAYLLNEALWDGYFFSGVTGWNGSGSSADSLANALERFVADPASLPSVHPRLRLLNRGMASAADAGFDLSEYGSPQTPGSPLRPHNRMAQRILLDGGFNVNSVSVDAWKAILSGLSGQGVVRVDTNGNLSLESANNTMPFGTQATHLGGSGPGDTYNGHRPLTLQEVDDLANAIVLEIRERITARGGPFLSMGEFVNRRLPTSSGPHAAHGLAGVLQAAINRVGVLNRDVEEEWNIETNVDGFFTFGGSPDGVQVPHVQPEAFGDSTRRGMSQHLDQRAILSVIGSSATVRSDTFRIRAYGSTLGDPAQSGGAQAWCEAIVQRVPDFVDSANEAAARLNTVNPVNKRFGRQYRIVSFRWMNPDEI